MTSTTHDALVFLLIAGSPAVGSFLNVLIDRLPRGQSIVSPRSACRSCGHVLGARDLIPILSYLFVRGHCRHCGAAIPPWHLYVEIAAIFAAVFAVLGSPPLAPVAGIALAAAFLWLLLALLGTDLLWFRLPDVLTGLL
ncbi:MAG TPA: prepilin peptidase, partial [Paracoccaceae bacterium]|nr:prepilin peptidase [Paracoccaceae bacterium]